MSLEIAWTIEVGGVLTTTDLTDRCTGIQIKQPLGFMQPASQTCSLTFDNFDGALTPGAGGTYSSIAWFEQAVFISCTINGTDTAQVFHGLIDDFNIVDDGVTSTVTLAASDWLSLAARATGGYDVSNTTPYDWTKQVNLSMQAFAARLGEEWFPYLQGFGGAATWFFSGDVHLAASTVQIRNYFQAEDALGDIQIKYEQAGVPSVIWPTVIVPTVKGSNTWAEYKSGIVGDTLTRTDTDATTFVFTEGTPSANELPVGKLDRGFNIERIINNAVLTSNYTTNTSTATNSASLTEIGGKSLFVTESSMFYDTDVQRMADNIVNRFSTVRFMARKVQLDSAQFAATDSGSKEELAKLFDVRNGLWQVATVSYTPAGSATQQTDITVIYGRTINATPGRTTITLDLLPAQDYQSFVLNSDTLGVLDTNRLG